MTPSLRLLLAPLAIVLLFSSIHADVTVPGETGNSLRRIQAVDKSLAGGEVAEAVEELQRILDEAGDDLVPVNPRWSVRARRLCHQRLAALPPAALKAYREKVDARARGWLEQGEARRDTALLRKVVDEAFASRAGDRALDLLGDLAFERGDFDAAERWWRHIALPAGEDRKTTDTLVFPDPEVDVARVRAKQLLARLYRGEREGLAAAIKKFAEQHPKASGEFAGRSGNYAETLQSLLTAPHTTVEDWPTFAGAASRNRLLRQAPGRPNWRVPRPGPTWVRRLDGRPVLKDGTPDAIGSAQTLAFHPILVGDQAFVADARYVRAFDLRTGEAQIWFDLAADGGARDLDLTLKRPALPGLSYTLSAEGDRLFIRMGAQTVEPRPTPGGPGEAIGGRRWRERVQSFLVCIDRRKPRQKIWLEKARSSDTMLEFFEGTPLVFDGRAFAAAVRFEGGGAITAIACHDAETGALRWRQPVDVCDVQGAEEAKPRRRQHLLTRAGSRVVYCSHSGAVVALEADTGRRAWAVRYPSRGRQTDEAKPSPRDLAPPIYASGRLFVAPLDLGRILCLDPETGKLLWESEPAFETVQLLGAADGNLIVTTTDGIRALAIDTGRTRRDTIQPPEGSSLPSFGRGLLAAGCVYWPTARGLRVLDQSSLELVDDPAAPFNHVANEIRGNLAAANGCLVVADNEHLTAYVPPRVLLEQRRSESKAEPESPAARLRLAIAEADAGMYPAALKDLALVDKEAADDDRVEGVLLKTVTRRLRHDVLRADGEAAAREGKWEEAAAMLVRASGTEFAFDDRAQALADRARLWEKARQPGKAAEAWQELLTLAESERTRAVTGHAQDARWHLNRLIKEHGREIYDPIERRARERLTVAGDNAGALEELLRTYPNSQSAVAALGRLSAKSDAPGLAASAQRRLLVLKPADAATGLARLAQLYERSDCWHAAQNAWLRLARDHPDFVVPGHTAARAFVPEHLKSSEPLRRAGLAGPAVSLPLVRRWEVRLDPGERMLVPQSPFEEGFLFFVSMAGAKATICCRAAVDGKLRWQKELPHEVTDALVFADLVMVAGARGVQALRIHDGVSEWAFVGTALADFRLAGDALLFFADRRQLVALDAASGQPLWSLDAPGARLRPIAPAGRFFPRYFAGVRRTLVQVSGGRCWVVDVERGRILRELPTSTDPWPRDPVALDATTVAVVHDLTTVSAIDLDDGKERWRHAARKPSVTAAAPRLVGDARMVFLLSDGWIWEALDTRTGKPAWTQGNADWIALRESSEAAPTLDEERIYFVVNDVLYGLNRGDGRITWQSALPERSGPWALRRTGDVLAVHPSGVVRPPPPTLVEANLRPAPKVWARRFPILLLDPADGSPIERLNYYQDRSPAAVQFLGGGAAVTLSGSSYGLQPRGKAR